MAGGTPERTQHIEITATLGRQAFEALYLELRRLAKRHGAEIREFRVERVAGPPEPRPTRQRPSSMI